MSYVVEENCGHATKIFDGISALHANARKQGMSDAAIARLPKIPTKVKPLAAGLPPVLLATRPHPRSPSELCIPLAKRPKRAINPIAQEYRRFLATSIAGKAKTFSRDLVAILSKASDYSEYRLRGAGRDRYLARVRAVGILAAVEHGLSNELAAAIFGRERTAVFHAAEHMPTWLKDPNLRRIKAELDAALKGAA